jgi:TonB family protein
MKLTKLGWTACAAALAAITAAAQPRGTIVDPDWVRRPSGESLAEHYPDIGTQLEIEGFAVLSCRVDVKGRLNSCDVMTESPKGMGFGRAAVGMADEFEMRPQTLNGLPTSGGVVRIPIRFALPLKRPAEPPPKARTDRALDAAYRLVDTMRMPDAAVESWDGVARRYEFDDGDAAPADARSQAATALRSAARARKAEFRDAYANAYASVLSEAEIDGLTRFVESPAAKALRSDATLAAMQQLVGQEGVRALLARAGETFCAAKACLAPADVERVWRTPLGKTGRIDNPQWVYAPDEDELSAARPPVAQLLNLSGVVRLACRLDTTGDLTGCAVEEEAPEGLGFGVAALGLADSYRLNSLQLQGVAGRPVTVRVGFAAADAEEAFRPPPPGSARALVLARALVAETGEQFRANAEARAKQVQDAASAEPQLEKAALDAFRAAADQVQAQVIEAAASVLAAHLSEEHLAALVAYRESPAGKAQEAHEVEFATVAQNAVDHVGDQIIADARAAYCKVRDCTLPPHLQPKAASPDPSTRKP